MKRSSRLQSRTPLERRTRLEAKTPLRAKSWGVKRKAGGTKHSRRERHRGFMLFTKHRECRARLLPNPGPCRYGEDGLSEAAHLGEKFTTAGGDGYRAHDITVAPLCGWHHRDGGHDQSKGPFADMTREQRRVWRREAIADNQAAWNALTDAERERWNQMATQKEDL